MAAGSDSTDVSSRSSSSDGGVSSSTFSSCKPKDEDSSNFPACMFCRKNTSNDRDCGELYVYEPRKGAQKFVDQKKVFGGSKNDDTIIAHTFCLKCSYCSRFGATLCCDEGDCPLQFHFPCGRTNEVFYEYFDKFRSVCLKHEPVRSGKRINPKRMGSFRGVSRAPCTICQELVPSKASRTVVYSACCNAYFHHGCVLTYSIEAASYHTRCPNCKNENVFRDALNRAGVYIPIRDATWETTTDYQAHFAAQRMRPSVCSALDCVFPQGREFQGIRKSNVPVFVYCHDCGSEAAHRECAQNEPFGKRNDWLCIGCRGSREKNRNAFLKKLEKFNDRTPLLQASVENMNCHSVDLTFDIDTVSVSSESFCVCIDAAQVIENASKKSGAKRALCELDNDEDTDSVIFLQENNVSIVSNNISQQNCVESDESLPSSSSVCPLFRNTNSSNKNVLKVAKQQRLDLDADIVVVFEGTTKLNGN